MENETKTEQAPGTGEEKALSPKKMVGDFYDLCEMLGIVTIAVMLVFAFIIRLNIVDGTSMNQTLQHGEYLIVEELGYTPQRGDIVVIHDVTATPYDKPLVKRVIATEFQTVEIDFNTWTLKVDGVVVDEPYRYLDPNEVTLTARHHYDAATGIFSMTVPEGEIFVLGDNRHNSADSRQREIGTIDTRCVVGHAVMRVFPLSDFTVFQ